MGMIMQVEPIYDCYNSLCRKTDAKPHLIYLTPQGKTLTQKRVRGSLHRWIILPFLCGHYGGIDERVIEELQPEEISVGDYVLTGGELPALDSCGFISRMLPGVLSEDECFEEESHYSSLLEYPQYTVLMNGGKNGSRCPSTGHHANVDKWRRQQSLKRTFERRPDMLEKADLSEEDRKYLSDLK